MVEAITVVVFDNLAVALGFGIQEELEAAAAVKN